jgi:succinoglycan biosynthesis protein ExoU
LGPYRNELRPAGESFGAAANPIGDHRPGELSTEKGTAMTNRTGGEVCVIIPAFDAAATVGRAVRSALAQREVREVIVVDDASRDATSAAAAAAGDGSGRLRLLRLDRNRGPAAARNAALRAGSAPLIAILDADDHLLPERFARLANDGSWDLIVDNILFLPEQDAIDPDLAALADVADRRRRLDFAEFVRRNISQPGRARSELGFLKPVMRRDMLSRLGLRYDETLRLGEDFILYATALARGARFDLSARCGYVAIERAVSLSGRHRTADLAALAAAEAVLLAELAANGRRAERRILARHLAGVQAKAAHRLFLERKRQGGMIAATAPLLPRPITFARVAGALLRDKIGGPPPPLPQRFLFGATEFA